MSIERLQTHLQQLHNLSIAYHMLFWDQNVFMPPDGDKSRAAQMATLKQLHHEKLTSEETARVIEAARAELDNGDSDNARLVHVASEDYTYASALPGDFVARYTRTTAEAFTVWKQAKETNNYALFAPMLQRIIDLKLEEADIRGYDDHPYDVLLGMWERGMTTKRVRELFDAHRDDLVALSAAVNAQADLVDDSTLHQHFPVAGQQELAQRASRAIGIDYDTWAHFATSPHPFCLQIARDDIRITTRFVEDFFNPAFYGTLHESGHGLHGRGIAPHLDGTFLSNMEDYSHGLAESQSRTWENLVGRSRAFWEWFFPQAQAVFPEQFKDADAEMLYRAVNRSYAQPIRIEADELTYNLHIMLRFELEVALVEGAIRVDKLPDAWNDKVKAYFGITPEDHTRGVLQDVHYSMGGIGAFTGYAIGNLLASQFYTQAEQALPDIPAQIAQGNFAPLREWLTTNIYQHGRKFNAEEMAQRVTGKPIQSQDFVTYLREKYTAIYEL
jgi:carboxypeptidase Taq